MKINKTPLPEQKIHEYLSIFARQVYEKNPAIPSGFVSHVHQKRIIEKGNDYAMVLSDLDKIVILFRGSDDFGDWWKNLHFIQKVTEFINENKESVGKGKVHCGFLSIWKNIKGEVLEAVKEFYKPGKKIYITGHSLGGVLGTFCADKLARIYGEVELVTFGSPKVGGETYKKWFDTLPVKYTRYVNGRDIVTRLARWYMGYCHVGKLINLKGSVIGRIGYMWFGSAIDHNMDHYIYHLANRK